MLAAATWPHAPEAAAARPSSIAVVTRRSPSGVITSTARSAAHSTIRRTR